MNYEAFIDEKVHYGAEHGFDPVWMPPILFDFQQAITDWAIRKGRSAIFADCGLGKTFMQLTWAENIVRKTNKRVLVLTPLAVAFQTVKEGEKIGIEVNHRRDGLKSGDKIIVTNYERLHYFNPEDFDGVVCDESSILKNFDGKIKQEITDFMRKRPYRLLCTATAAPNDYPELGTSSEALGEMGSTDMLQKFFKAVNGSFTRGGSGGTGAKRFAKDRQFTGNFYLRPHAERDFWRWVVSWARAIRKPSDMGFDDDGFILPPLNVQQHVVKAAHPRDGMLFDIPAVGLEEQRADLRNTLNERCEMAAQLINAHDRPAVAWCNLNAEGDLLEKLIPGSVQVKGSDTNEWKEMAAQWFIGDKCICKEPMFRAILTSWQKERLNIGKNIIESIARSASSNAPNTSAKTEIKNPRISPSTIKTIRRNGAEQWSKQTSETDDDANDMPTMKSTEINKKNTLNQQERETQTPALGIFSNHIDFRSQNTENSKVEVAQFADPREVENGEDTDYTSTTITSQENSGAFCAPIVTLDSENLAMIANVSKEPSCICGHLSGRRVLITKPTIFGYGLNLQMCSHMTFFPSHSYEQYYQAVRRCWRFGQKNPVTVDMITTDGQNNVLKNLQSKADKAAEMFDYLVALMRNELILDKRKPFSQEVTLPDWLKPD